MDNINRLKANFSLVLVSLLIVSGCSLEQTDTQATEAVVKEVGDADSTDESLGASIPLIFDTDMAIDDWSALLMLQRHPGVDLLALTIPGSGESHCGPGELNALALLDMSLPDSNVPVACGDKWPLDGYFVFPEAWQKNIDSLYNVPVPASQRTPYKGHAIELIHETIQQSEEPIVILATGPMTNIAQWLEKYPDDKKNVSRIVLMGGSIDAPGNIIVPGFTDNNPNKRAEWNFYIDPLATKIVLESGLPIELVGLDVTNHVLVTSEFAKYFKSVVDNPSAKFWDDVLDANDQLIDSDEYYFWDVLAALVVVDRDTFCRGEMAALTSAIKPAGTPWLPTSDMTIPDINWQGEPRQHLDAETAGVVSIEGEGVKNSLICRATDSIKAFDIFVDTLIDAKDRPTQPDYPQSRHIINDNAQEQ